MPQTVRISHSARLWVDGHVFNLGEVSGEHPQALCDELATRLEMLAKILRGAPEHASEAVPQ
jgi:hypothetical protein